MTDIELESMPRAVGVLRADTYDAREDVAAVAAFCWLFALIFIIAPCVI